MTEPAPVARAVRPSGRRKAFRVLPDDVPLSRIAVADKASPTHR
ncbi:hypothetical protein [Streptomyces sp. 16-176A]